VDLESGERTLIAKKVARAMGVSPDSKWFLYLRDKHMTAYNIETGKTVVVDATAGKSFVDEDDDHAAEKPIYGVAGWSKDGKYLILNHKYDVWALPIEGGKAINLTGGVGDAQEIQFRLVRFGQGGRGGRGGGGLFGALGDDDGVDLTKPLTLAATGQWTKKTGYWQVAPGGAPKALIWADKQIGGVAKADSADRVIFTQQTFAEFPDYWTSNTAFEVPKKVTDANPQLVEYAWGSKVLVDYKNSKGKRLQATLTLPAGYEKGKKYPMLVYFYEIMSNTHHTFSMPVYDDRPHMSTYASDGYLVLQPDVVYEIGKPGSSAVDCVTAAVKKVIELGYADPKHIGLQGHSWGGYESSYIVTQTDMFAAVVTGAPLTNLISMYDELYKSTGTVNGGILETSQGRMGVDVTPWNAHDLYEQQSPVYNVRNIKTPFLILQGTADGAVDWNQGLEFYNAARRNGKQVIFLSYPDEPHHLAKKENQKDFQVRMKQYFDHYLKGTPAPKWMTDGVPQLRKGGVIQ
jgi:acetyl esterase/lipase